MNSINIQDKHGKLYTLKIDENNFKLENIKNYPYWSVKYEVWKKGEGLIGHGSLKLSCSKEHEHISDEEILNALVNMGANKIKIDIDNKQDIESKGYNFYVRNCTK